MAGKVADMPLNSAASVNTLALILLMIQYFTLAVMSPFA